MPTSPQRIFACALSLLLVLAVCVPTAAFANVQKTDIIAGQTVEERGYALSQCPSIDARYAIATDANGNVLFERGADTASPIASMTKIMTAIVALDYNPALDMQVTVTAKAAEIGESSAGLQAGDQMDMTNALRAMMVASGNDAAQSIAACIGASLLQSEGGDASSEDACVSRFVQAMNDKAAALGLSDTVFNNPHGLDFDEYTGDLHSTARDVAKEVAYAMKNNTFRDIVKEDRAVVTVTRNSSKVGFTLSSTDTLLGTYKGTIGVKTGYTKKAGACYAGANQRDGNEYYVVVMDSSSEEQRFVDAETIWDWIYANRKDYRLINTPHTVDTTLSGTGEAYPLVAEVAHKDWIDRTIKATVADPNQTMNVYTWNGNISQEVAYDDVTGTIHTGDKVGTLTFKQHNKVIATVDLVAAEDSEAPGFFEGIGIFWQRLGAQITGGTTVADSTLYNETPYLVDKGQA